MFKRSKGFLAGLTVASLLWATVFAAPIEKKITAVYNDIKVFVDGEQVQTTDGGGKVIQPFIADGTAYLPIRAVGQILDKETSWDGKTNSIYIGRKPLPKPPIEAPATVTVKNADELVAALGSNKIIKVEPGTYNLSKVKNKVNSENVSWTKVEDGEELTLAGIVNLTIEGSGKEQSEIVVEPRFANIFKFMESSTVSLKNLKIGHTIIKDYECNAGVVTFDKSNLINIDGCTLYGCGSEGIFATESEDLNFKDSVIENCNLRMMTLSDCRNMNFTNGTFRNCKFASMMNFWNSKGIVFDKCLFDKNQSDQGWAFLDFISSEVRINNSKITNNKADYFMKAQNNCSLDFSGTTFEGNTFKDTDVAPNLPD